MNENKNVPARPLVFLIHGLFRSAASMRFPAKNFSNDGFDVRFFDYQSRRAGIREHGERLAGTIEETLRILPAGTPVFFMTHSMGGLLLRAALSILPPETLSRVSAIVMLAPPNRGSYWPDIVKFAFPPLWFLNRSLRDLSCSPESAANKIELPRILPPLKIIAAEFDIKVARKFLPIQGWRCEIEFVPTTHDWIRRSRAAYETAKLFFTKTSESEKS